MACPSARGQRPPIIFVQCGPATAFGDTDRGPVVGWPQPESRARGRAGGWGLCAVCPRTAAGGGTGATPRGTARGTLHAGQLHQGSSPEHLRGRHTQRGHHLRQQDGRRLLMGRTVSTRVCACVCVGWAATCGALSGRSDGCSANCVQWLAPSVIY